MELPESLEYINNLLKEHFGIDSDTSKPIWRVVFSQDQFEWRKGVYDDITPGGIYLRTVEEVRWVPKYRQWVHEKYVLERLVGIPEMNREELPASKTSYELLYVFEDKNGNYLPPKFGACQFVINTVYAAQYGTKNLKKYLDPENSQEAYLKEAKKRTDILVEELFGEQSSLGGSTKTGESIIVPRNYEKGVH